MLLILLVDSNSKSDVQIEDFDEIDNGCVDEEDEKSVDEENEIDEEDELRCAS